MEGSTEEFFRQIVGKLSDEGWPAPFSLFASKWFDAPYIAWREGEKGNALMLSREKGDHRAASRFYIRVQILKDNRYVMVDTTPSLAIWPGDHDVDAIVGVLRHFRSVIDPRARMGAAL